MGFAHKTVKASSHPPGRFSPDGAGKVEGLMMANLASWLAMRQQDRQSRVGVAEVVQETAQVA